MQSISEVATDSLVNDENSLSYVVHNNKETSDNNVEFGIQNSKIKNIKRLTITILKSLIMFLPFLIGLIFILAFQNVISEILSKRTNVIIIPFDLIVQTIYFVTVICVFSILAIKRLNESNKGIVLEIIGIILLLTGIAILPIFSSYFVPYLHRKPDYLLSYTYISNIVRILNMSLIIPFSMFIICLTVSIVTRRISLNKIFVPLSDNSDAKIASKVISFLVGLALV